MLCFFVPRSYILLDGLSAHYFEIMQLEMSVVCTVHTLNAHKVTPF